MKPQIPSNIGYDKKFLILKSLNNFLCEKLLVLGTSFLSGIIYIAIPIKIDIVHIRANNIDHVIFKSKLIEKE